MHAFAPSSLLLAVDRDEDASMRTSVLDLLGTAAYLKMVIRVMQLDSHKGLVVLVEISHDLAAADPSVDVEFARKDGQHLERCLGERLCGWL